MRRKSPNNTSSHAMPKAHPHAGAIDIGARMHMAAVDPDCVAEPVRSFGAFTVDLVRLADWFEACGCKIACNNDLGSDLTSMT